MKFYPRNKEHSGLFKQRGRPPLHRIRCLHVIQAMLDTEEVITIGEVHKRISVGASSQTYITMNYFLTAGLIAAPLDGAPHIKQFKVACPDTWAATIRELTEIEKLL
ncbi:hypothetical protein F0170_16015 [Pseudomonas sp. MAFF 730085]|uniref:MarR family transcriptional regulator n=1 Tax=Pseudomonas kitaguniensis TaxID=2607908 RepID=A0A5N7JVD7_9PSED|nr:hypothetical protein [Pseudomonas kitaguniensis]MPQ85367.1 hypothetical protein [Pseudomonas kitaguniensis]